MSTTTTVTPSAPTLLASQANSTSASTFSAVIDTRTCIGGTLLWKVTNGASAPITQCQVNVLFAPTISGTPPTAASAGSVWKTIYSVGAGVVANAVSEWNTRIVQGGYMCLEFTASATNTVTIEGEAIILTDAVSV